MPKMLCDHNIVGIIVTREEALRSQILLTKSAKYPHVWAPPSGHADLIKANPSEKEFQAAARRQLREQTGLRATQLYMIRQERTVRPCGRVNGTHHLWRIYVAICLGELERNREIEQNIAWFTRAEVEEQIWFTARYEQSEVSEEEWQENPGLEAVWCNELDLLRLFDDAEKIFPVKP